MNKIEQEFPIPQKGQYKVYVNTITYNHVPYIEDCLNGVAMQQTDFPFVHHVIDDCSPDGEQDVIKAWIEKNCDLDAAEYYDNDICTITLAKAKNNSNYTISAYFLKKNMWGNPTKRELYTPWREACIYEAMCEGDDFWTDSHKLQKQVSFLDMNNDYGLCFTANSRLFEDTKEIKKDNKDTTEVDFYRLLEGNCIATLTTLFRTDILLQYHREIQPSQRSWRQGDYPVWLYFAFHSKIHCIADNTSTYRVVAGSASNQTSMEKYLEYIDSTYEIKYFYINKYKLSDNVKKRFLSEHHYRKFGVLLKNKKYRRAVAEIKTAPFNIVMLIKRCIKIIINKE